MGMDAAVDPLVGEVHDDESCGEQPPGESPQSDPNGAGRRQLLPGGGEVHGVGVMREMLTRRGGSTLVAVPVESMDEVLGQGPAEPS
jgi:hypothetical protein